MSILFTFPGQGAQKPGMLSSLPKHAVIKEVLDEASTILGHSVFEFDSFKALELNQNVQVAMTIAAYASFRYLTSEGILPQYVLGLSIGAFPAAICTGMITLEEGLNLVHCRGKLMSEAFPKDYGMAVIVGLPTQQVKIIINDVMKKGLIVYLSNINTEMQTTVSGTYEGLDEVCRLAVQQRAVMAKRLNINVPSHCLLLEKEAEKLLSIIKTIKFQQPKISYVSSSLSRVLFDINKIKEDLAYNMAKPVYWWETISMLEQRGIRLAIELSPGVILTSLSKNSLLKTQCISMDTTSLVNIRMLYQRHL